MDTEPTEWLRVDAVAHLLDVKPYTIRRLLNTGKLPGTFFGNREGWRIRKADVEALRGKLIAPEEQAAK